MNHQYYIATQRDKELAGMRIIKYTAYEFMLSIAKETRCS